MNEKPPQDERKARLAAALRENLKRRKSQARARAAEPSAQPAHATNLPQTPPKEPSGT